MGQLNADRYVGTRIEAWLHRKQPHTATLEIPELGVAVGTTVGQVRKENQDRVIIARLSVVLGSPPTTIFALCDGLGGMEDGAQCAEKTLAVLLNSFIQSPLLNIKDRLRVSIMAANQEIFGQYRQRGGATLSLLCRSIDSCFAVTVGDTRVYSLKPGSLLKQVSVDDTIAGELRRRAGFKENLDLEPFAHQLAQFVGVGPEIEPRFYELPRQTEMSYFIASDGAYNIGTAFEQILLNASGALMAVERIISVSRWMGGKDNASIICIVPDRREAQPTHQETMLELWNATGKFEMILERRTSMFDRQSNLPLQTRDPVNNQKDRDRKQPKGRAKGKRFTNEANNLIPVRPVLKIDFGKTEHSTKDLPPKKASSQDSQSDLTSLPAELRSTDNQSEEKSDGAHRGNV